MPGLHLATMNAGFRPLKICEGLMLICLSLEFIATIEILSYMAFVTKYHLAYWSLGSFSTQCAYLDRLLFFRVIVRTAQRSEGMSPRLRLASRWVDTSTYPWIAISCNETFIRSP